MVNGVGHRIQTTVAASGVFQRNLAFFHADHGVHALFLDVVHIRDGKGRFLVEEFVFENAVDVFRRQLFVQVIGHVLDGIAKAFAHFRRKIVAVVLLQNIANAAFARLAVDADDVGFVLAAHIVRIDRQIGNRPLVQPFLFTPLHTFGNGVLMAAGESGEHQRTCIGGCLLYTSRKVLCIAGSLTPQTAAQLAFAEKMGYPVLTLQTTELFSPERKQAEKTRLKQAYDAVGNGEMVVIRTCAEPHLIEETKALAAQRGLSAPEAATAVSDALAALAHELAEENLSLIHI